MSLYITLSMRNAERIVWKDLKKINEDFNLQGIPNEAKLMITFPNKSSIYLSGANNVTEIENFRGVPLKLVYIDECQSFKAYIENLIDDILSPALMDYAGSLCLIGTPGPVPTGFFHACSTKENVWSKHGWTFWDNPHIAQKSGKTHQQLLDRELKRRNVPATHPSIQREWFGKWELDSDSLILHYNAAVGSYSTLPLLVPPNKYHYLMGVDIGFNDSDAIAVLAYSDVDKSTYLIEEVVTPKQGITELVDQIQGLRSKYDISKIVMDMGGLGKKIGEEVIRRWQIPVEAAEKSRKMENLQILDDAMRTGMFKAKPNSLFVQDSYLVERDKDKSTSDKIVINSRFHSDIVDAVLYSFKLSPAFYYTKPKEAPKRGSKEWAEAQTNSMFELELAGYTEEARYDRWINTGEYSE